MKLCNTKLKDFCCAGFCHWLKQALRGNSEALAWGVKNADGNFILRLLAVIVVGSALYGVTVGMWRAPLQGVYSGVKIPLLLLLTCAANGLLNALFARFLGADMSFRQTLVAVGISFALLSVLLAAFSPISWFIFLNVSPLENGKAILSHSFFLLFHVCVIAYAGCMANVRLKSLLEQFCRTRSASFHVLLAWLFGNLLLGSQLAWVLRPFIGSPRHPVQFFRPDPFDGSFFEAVFRAFRHLFT